MKRASAAIVIALCALVAASGADAVATPPFAAVMTGLDNPRGLAWGPEGGLYVAESGRGGTTPCFATGRGPSFAGTTGAVTRLWHGTQGRVVTGLPSYTNAPTGMGATGPHDIALLGRGDASVSIGLGLEGDPTLRATCPGLGLMFGWLAEVPASGNWRLDVDLAAYEVSANPDGSSPPDSQPYGLLATPGATIATDAGGNDLLRVAANGSISTLAVFPSRSNSSRGIDSVPTSVAVGPDGAYYVGELASFAPGQANVWRVVPGEAPTIYKTGFTTIIDITFDSDGNLYVLEFRPGDLLRVPPVGAPSLVASGLVTPGSVTIGSDGTFYVSNCSIFVSTLPSPCGMGGSVVRIPG
jgi:hypothetical protein